MRIYLDSSAILKRYLRERGTEKVKKVYLEALNGEATLHLSTWNIGEIIGALGKYHRRGWQRHLKQRNSMQHISADGLHTKI